MEKIVYLDKDYNIIDKKNASISVTKEMDEDGNLISERWEILE